MGGLWAKMDIIVPYILNILKCGTYPIDLWLRGESCHLDLSEAPLPPLMSATRLPTGGSDPIVAKR